MNLLSNKLKKPDSKGCKVCHYSYTSFSKKTKPNMHFCYWLGVGKATEGSNLGDGRTVLYFDFLMFLQLHMFFKLGEPYTKHI